MARKNVDRVLPVGCEFEAQQRLDRKRREDVALVYRYRVLGYLADESDRLSMLFEPVSRRYRELGEVWQDGEDMFGDPVMKCTFLGDPPSPTREEMLATVGIEVLEPTSWDEIEANKQLLRRDRKALEVAERETQPSFS
jgi:hypothetical protein